MILITGITLILRWKMHGNRRNHYDPSLTTSKHVDTRFAVATVSCRFCQRIHSYPVLPQILILYHFLNMNTLLMQPQVEQ